MNRPSSESINGVWRTSMSKSSKVLVGEYLACIISTTTGFREGGGGKVRFKLLIE
jgi:hypothetical protein